METPFDSRIPLSAQPPQIGLSRCFGPSYPFTAFKIAEIEQSIAARFEHQVHQYADRLAIKANHQELTYGALNHAANRVAHAILAQRGEGEEPVALLFAPGIFAICAILGVLKTGKFFVPLDPSFPPARLNSMLEDTQPRLIVTDTQHVALACHLCPQGCQVVNIEMCDASLATVNPRLSLSADALAYVLYTSGSTGQPKGVVQHQRNVLYDIMNHTNILHLSADDRLTLLYSCSVIAGLRDIFSALLNGASLYPFDLKTEGVGRLAPWLFQHHITNYKSIPTVFRHFISTLAGEEHFPSLRLIQIGGESVYRRDIELYKQHFSPSCLFVHVLGATEVQNFAWYCIDKETHITGYTVPLSVDMMEGTTVLLLDEAGQEIGVNRPGEIAVKSRYSALGYWRRPDLTRAAFLPDPHGRDERIYRTGDLGLRHPDGCLDHIGRKDLQVKIRGNRVEITEIEGALVSLEGIKEAIVVAREDVPGQPRLIAYVVPAVPPGPTVSILRRLLAERVPDYMLPAAFVTLDALPLMPNGKVDRRAVPLPDRARPALEHPYVAPRTPIEEAVASIWVEVLNLDAVGVHDPFLELGGDSLLAVRIMTRLLDIFHLEVPQRLLLQAATVARLATIITQYMAEKAEVADLEHWLAEVEGLTDDHS
jgi:amino acid adenylation domain-containing protein